MSSYTLEPIGFIRSTVKGREDAPRQGPEGAAQPFQGRARTRHDAAWNGKQSDACQLPYRRNNPDGFGRQVRRQPRFEGFSLSIIVPDEQKAESVFNALADGGKVTMPLEKTFWAPKFGMLEDRFGVGWMVSVQHKP